MATRITSIGVSSLGTSVISEVARAQSTQFSNRAPFSLSTGPTITPDVAPSNSQLFELTISREREDRVLDASFDITGGDLFEELILDANNPFSRAIGILRKSVFERRAETFMENNPEIIFISDYTVNGKLVGNLLVWEKYSYATHYEVLKRNIFKEDKAPFERVLFLNRESLAEERNEFVDYIKNTLGFTELDPESYFVMMDPILKQDRIYEYRVVGVRVPSSPRELEYDLTLRSKDLLNPTTIDSDSSSTIFSLAGITLGSNDLAWVISAVNDGVKFFGRSALEKPLPFLIGVDNFEGGEFDIAIPKNINDLMCMLQEAYVLFDIRAVFRNLLRLLGLRDTYIAIAVEALDETRGVFSYDQFRDKFQNAGVLGNVLEIIESSFSEEEQFQVLSELSKLGVTIPINIGSEEITSILGITKVLKYINETIIAVLNAHETDSVSQIKALLNRIEADRLKVAEDTTDLGVEQVRDIVVADTTDAIVQTTIKDLESNFVGVTVGSKTSKKSESPVITIGGSQVATKFGEVNPLLNFSSIVTVNTTDEEKPKTSNTAFGFIVI